MKKKEELIEKLREKGNELEIPSSLHPEWMEETLKEHEQKQYFRKGRLYPALAAAASFALIGGLLLHIQASGLLASQDPSMETGAEEIVLSKPPENAAPAESSKEQELLALPRLTYEEIYARLSESWQAQNETVRYAEDEVMYELAATEGAADLAAPQQKMQASKESYGRTNTQEEQIDEGDRIKNDGRYLYQIARKQTEEGDGSAKEEQVGIQIIDTKEGLKETAFVDGFRDLEEFYIWKDLLIVIENKYYETAEPLQSARKWAEVEDMAVCGVDRERCYHEISIYQTADKSSPRKLKTFTLQGNYESSRIAEGYFYGISSFTAGPGEGEKDYKAYIPSADGEQIAAERIYCPAYAQGTSYLVLVSIDLSNPTAFADTRAVLAGSGTYYVSPQNIYMTHYQSVYEEELQREGLVKDRTQILRFSYTNGRFYAQAEGEVPGRIENSFSMDEYEGNLRTAVTVQEYQAKKIVDDRTGKTVGYDYGESRQTSALYILGRSLITIGKIEGLAEGEQIRSARFLETAGYMVTFRQTDPLFAFDLTDPRNPRLLGELKVSGFSEYLHFYGENSLLGFGMEADEETGAEKGLKLSMFDITDPAEPKEQTRIHLKDYNYSEALWDHHALLIDPAENLIGFEAEGSSQGRYWKNYLVYAYEEGAFTQKLKIQLQTDAKGYYRTRATYIGETLYLLFEDGRAQSYNRTTGALIEEI